MSSNAPPSTRPSTIRTGWLRSTAVRPWPGWPAFGEARKPGLPGRAHGSRESCRPSGAATGFVRSDSGLPLAVRGAAGVIGSPGLVVRIPPGSGAAPLPRTPESGRIDPIVKKMSSELIVKLWSNRRADHARYRCGSNVRSHPLGLSGRGRVQIMAGGVLEGKTRPVRAGLGSAKALVEQPGSCLPRAQGSLGRWGQFGYPERSAGGPALRIHTRRFRWPTGGSLGMSFDFC
jgi:hypothetical protein